jgi:opacity protein-like surface antigen
MNRYVAVLALAFSGAVSTPLWGQTGEFWFNFGESLLQNNGIGTDLAFSGTPNDIQLNNGWRFSFRFGFNQGDHFGHEIQYAFNRTYFQYNDVTPVQSEAMHFHQAGYNFLYYLNTDRSKIRPFVTAGVHFDDFVPPGAAINYGSSNKFGLNFGAGVKFHIKGMFAGRVDAREYMTGKPAFGLFDVQGLLWQTELSAGVGIGF